MQGRRRDWTPTEDALLGTLPDRVVGERLGVRYQAVQRRRAERGIRAFKPQHGAATWAAVDAVLGTAPDAAIAERFGLPTQTLTDHRIRRGIAPHVRRVDWSVVEDLGELPDTHIAARIGVSQSGVREARQRLGIRAWRPSGRRRRVRIPVEPITPLHVGHPVFDEARRIVGQRSSGLSILHDPLHEELLSVATLALLEGADPTAAVQAARRAEMHWRYHTAPLKPDLIAA
jgi:hypothetical protein